MKFHNEMKLNSLPHTTRKSDIGLVASLKDIFTCMVITDISISDKSLYSRIKELRLYVATYVVARCYMVIISLSASDGARSDDRWRICPYEI